MADAAPRDRAGLVRDHTQELADATDQESILAVINAAAEAYRGVIPVDRWHEPYMSAAELAHEVADGVTFCGTTRESRLVGVMGAQPVRDVLLIRHAYVMPGHQGEGIGGRLLRRILASTERRVLVGTWAAASWAIAFYERHGFTLVSREQTVRLLATYWRIPARQVDTSIVLELGGSQWTHKMQTP